MGGFSGSVYSGGSGGVTAGRRLYCWDGRCAVWDTRITDNSSGVSIFIPTYYSTQMSLNVCPGGNSAFGYVFNYIFINHIMRILTLNILLIIFGFISFPNLLSAQKKDPIMALLENKKEIKEILQNQKTNDEFHKGTFVLFENRLYHISNFSHTMIKNPNSLTMRIVSNPDSIKGILINQIKSLIVFEKKEDLMLQKKKIK